LLDYKINQIKLILIYDFIYGIVFLKVN